MELVKAEAIAEEVKTKLQPFCDRIEIAGSIRRRRPFVHDIDLVCIPANQGQFYFALKSLGTLTLGGQKLMRCQLPTIVLDVYIATPETWATLLLIRTGSKAHNIRLCMRAKSYLSGTLKADGAGLFKPSSCETMERVAGDTEESIFEALGLPYKRPEERE